MTLLLSVLSDNFFISYLCLPTPFLLLTSQIWAVGKAAQGHYVYKSNSMPLKLSAKLLTNFRVPGFPSAWVMSVQGIFSQTIKSSTAKANWDKCVELYHHSGQHSNGASFKCKQNCWGTQSHHFSGRGPTLSCYWDLTTLSLKFSIELSLSTFCLSVERHNYVTFVHNKTDEIRLWNRMDVFHSCLYFGWKKKKWICTAEL